MDGWTVESVFYVGCLVFAGLCLAWACTLGFRSLLRENSPQQPGDSPAPPDLGSPRCSPSSTLNARALRVDLAPGWRFR